MIRKIKPLALTLIILIGSFSCDENENFVIFGIENDVQLGQQVHSQIASDPNYNILSPEQYPEAYSYLYDIVNSILASGEVAYAEEFEWQVYILDDNTLNAFATPGGYMYVYTGLINYLESADALAGVIGHEMAHADLRHTVRNLQRIYGVNLLLSIALGNDASALEEVAAQIAGSLAGLQFSREFETEADARSVEYLAATVYACNGAAYFFEKMNEEGDSAQPPEFLSTHPNPDNRIEDINAKADEVGCNTDPSNANYQALKNSLP